MSNMTSLMTRTRWTAIATAMTLAVIACNNVESVLEVRDPDIINPSDVQSAAGAEASRIGALARHREIPRICDASRCSCWSTTLGGSS